MIIKQKIVDLFPIIGIAVFVGLYIFSSTLYPGGSHSNVSSVGFDWVNNYWCDMMSGIGINRQPNPAQPFAVTAMIILCFSVMIFFVRFAQTYAKKPFWRILIKASSVLSMIFAILIFTKYHDLMSILSSVFGIFLVIGIIKELYSSKLTIYKISGVLCIALLAMNNYMYYSRQLVEALPLLQKFTFIIILLWIIGLNYELIKTNSAPTSRQS